MRLIILAVEIHVLCFRITHVFDGSLYKHALVDDGFFSGSGADDGFFDDFDL